MIPHNEWPDGALLHESYGTDAMWFFSKKMCEIAPSFGIPAGTRTIRPDPRVAELEAEVARLSKLVCQTCGGHGMVGGPSYADPGNGGDDCPDCVGRIKDEVVSNFNGQYGIVTELKAERDQLRARIAELEANTARATIAQAYEADFSAGTWTFKPVGQFAVTGGMYALVPIKAAA